MYLELAFLYNEWSKPNCQCFVTVYSLISYTFQESFEITNTSIILAMLDTTLLKGRLNKGRIKKRNPNWMY
jgi:hypothetical protein